MTSAIYWIFNQVVGRAYVGSSVDAEKRLYNHRWHLLRGRHPNQKLQRAWDKYGNQAFLFEVMEPCLPDQLLVREQVWIDYLDLVKQGYNIAPVAGNTLGRPTSRKIRALIGAKSKARTQGADHPLFGTHHSAETIAKISAANTGRTASETTRRKMSEARRGKPASIKMRQHLTVLVLANAASADVRAKISASKIGIKRAPFSAEWRQRISAALTGKKRSAATCERLRISALAREARRRGERNQINAG